MIAGSSNAFRKSESRVNPTIDYFFSFISAYSYLGSPRLHDIAHRHGARIIYKPIKIDKLILATGGTLMPQRAPERRAYRLEDLARLREYYETPMILEPKYVPTEGAQATAMVTALQAEGRNPRPLIDALLRAVWVEEQNIADPSVLEEAASSCGLDAKSLLATAGRPEFATSEAAHTDEAIARGAFGVPTYAVGNQLFWGQDRLALLDWALGRT